MRYCILTQLWLRRGLVIGLLIVFVVFLVLIIIVQIVKIVVLIEGRLWGLQYLLLDWPQSTFVLEVAGDYFVDKLQQLSVFDFAIQKVEVMLVLDVV